MEKIDQTRIRRDKPIRAYIYTSAGSLMKPSHTKLVSFVTLEEGLKKFNDLKPRYTGKQILFIDFSITPSRIIHLLNQ